MRALLIATLLTPTLLFAKGWSWSIGYNNPPGAVPGVNFLKVWDQWAFEVGVGYVNAQNTKDDPDTPEDEEEDTTAIIGGDLDIKYFFSGGRTFQPFVQGGTGYGIALGSDKNGAAAGVGGFFVGVGFFLGNTSDFHVYTSANVGNDLFFSIGAGSGF